MAFWGKYTYIWVKNEDGVRCLKLKYRPEIYVEVRKSIQDDIKLIHAHRDCHQILPDYSVSKSEHIHPEPVLKITVTDPSKLKSFVRFLHQKHFTIFNSDINPRDKFFVDTSSFPFGLCEIIVDKEYEFHIKMLDNVWDPLYSVPELTIMELTFGIDKGTNIFPQWDDPLVWFKTVFFPSHVKEECFSQTFQGIPEQDLLLELNKILEQRDPDILLIEGGDRFLMNYLAHRAHSHDLLSRFFLGRLKKKMRPVSTVESRSYTSYGMMVNKITPTYIPGRIYIDPLNSFFYRDSKLHGLIELSRLGGIPPDRCARNSIGTVLTAIEIKIAHQCIPKLLVPEVKAKGERIKSSAGLLTADNGGVVFPALPGIYEKIWGIDFASLYPTIMMNHNISSETVMCNCCFDSQENLVPEVEYYVCTKQEGIVCKAMKLLLSKRLSYKYLKQDSTNSSKYNTLNQIDSALKWVLVSAFGYLGFRNARWGSIESHQCVTAYARYYLRIAERIVSEEGYETIAGITDSLFIRAKEGTTDNLVNVKKLISKISKVTGVPMNVDGFFDWIVFTNVRDSPDISALNRYFGRYSNGIMKIRGIESRKQSTCKLVKDFQQEVLQILSLQENRNEFLSSISLCMDKLELWKENLKKGISRKDLIIKIRSGKGSKGYRSNTIQALVAREYGKKGHNLEPGQSMRYIVRDFHGDNRIIIEPEITEDCIYDVEWYIKLLEKAFLDLFETVMLQEYGRIKLPKSEEVSALHSFFLE